MIRRRDIKLEINYLPIKILCGGEDSFAVNKKTEDFRTLHRTPKKALSIERVFQAFGDSAVGTTDSIISNANIGFVGALKAVEIFQDSRH